MIPTNNMAFWGYSLAEYSKMFDLQAKDLESPILDCAAGPASFNAELTKQGGKVVSCDPIYEQSVEDITAASDESFNAVSQTVKQDTENFVWETYKSAEALISTHRAARDTFLQDFAAGKQQGRYTSDALPNLSFENFQFKMALCSHFLFLRQQAASVTFQVDAIKELCRVANEVRIFPLLDHTGENTSLAGPVMMQLQAEDYGVEIREVPYKLWKNGNAMMRVWATTCDVEE